MKKVTLSYEQSEVIEDEVRRRVEVAFDVLFDSVFEEILPLQAGVPLPNVSTDTREVSSWRIRR